MTSNIKPLIHSTTYDAASFILEDTNIIWCTKTGRILLKINTCKNGQLVRNFFLLLNVWFYKTFQSQGKSTQNG